MKKIISAISSAAVLFSAVPFSGNVMAEDDAIKIMCIGDSITDGYVSEYAGSYRKFIYHNLTEKGYNIDMVGAKDGGWTPTYTDEETGETWEFDNENTGYSGYTIKEYGGRSGIYETLISTDCLAKTQPDIVTLQIGTNDIIDNHDIDTAGERLEVLVDYILENLPENAVLFVSCVPQLDPNRPDVYEWFGNYRHSADWSETYDDALALYSVAKSLIGYNNQIQALVTKKQDEGKNIIYSDAGKQIKSADTQLFDGVHPNNDGYKAMGERWTELIEDYLSGNTSSTEPNEEYTFKIGNLVKLNLYILGYPHEEYTKEELEKYDMNKDKRIDVFDSILMREAVIENVNLILEKRKEPGNEDFLDFSGFSNIIVYPDDDDEEPQRVKPSGSASSSTGNSNGNNNNNDDSEINDEIIIS